MIQRSFPFLRLSRDFVVRYRRYRAQRDKAGHPEDPSMDPSMTNRTRAGSNLVRSSHDTRQGVNVFDNPDAH